MTKPPQEKDFLKDFHEFTHSHDQQPPQEIQQKILNQTKSWLQPSAKVVFAKLLLVHSFFGSLSLAICEQFGLNPFNTQVSLADYFMSLGHSFCMTLCGFIFIGFSLSFAWLILNSEEFKVVQKNIWIQISSLSFLSLATFAACGAEITLSLALLWTLGAFIGGSLPVWSLPKIKLLFS